MKLIIDISEGDYKWIKDHVMTVNEQRIANGIPLDDVFDNIRAEIYENINYNKKMNYQGIVAGLLLTLNIIDKYRNEVSE